MELAVVVKLQGGDGVDLVFELDRDATVGDFATMALRAMRIDEALRVFHVRPNRWLDPNERIGDAGIARADELILATPATLVRGPGALSGEFDTPVMPYEIAVVGGPLAGTTTPINFGSFRIGRDPRSDIVLDDASVAPAHLLLEVTRAGVTVTPHAAPICVDGETLSTATVIPAGAWIEVGLLLLEVRPTVARPYERHSDGAGRVPFNRPPRPRTPDDHPEFSLPAPPDDHKPRKIPLLVTLLPLVGSFGAVVTFGAIQGNLATPAKWPWQFAMFALLSPIMQFGNWLSERRSGRGDFIERRTKYLANASELIERLHATQRAEMLGRRAGAPDPAELRLRALHLSPTLWERRIHDEDALALRVGSARILSAFSLTIADGGSDALRAAVLSDVAQADSSPLVPKCFTLSDFAAVGIAGSPGDCLGVATSIVMQAATLHSPRELAICLALPEDAAQDWDWCKWLPHCDPVVAPLAGSLCAIGPDATSDLIERVLALIERRRLQRSDYGSDRSVELPIVLVVIDETVVRQRPRAARLLENAAAHGVRVIWLARESRNLPGECGEYIEVHDIARATMHAPSSGEPEMRVILDNVATPLAREVALALAPVVDHTTAAAVGGSIPSVSRLADLLGMAEPTADGIVRRWSHPPQGLTAPVGEAADGAFSIDMRHDGPHGLVAGTTGAGKSELLQSFVVSLAATYPPTRLNFLFVDYKGGTAFSSCTELPHAVGMVTDLDGQLAQRVIVSLNAELKRREHLLREYNARDLIDLETRRPQDAPPSLLLIIDEFAALAREVPDFIDGVVDIAQRGRSLGIHLLLATQRPSGVVNDNIRANTNLRIALRVADTQDSTDILGRDDAAHIPRALPGRAFARTGQSDFTAFQAAWAGGPARGTTSTSGNSIRVFKLSGQIVLWADERAPQSAPTATELTLLCACIREAAQRTEQPPSIAPWLAPLQTTVALETLIAEPTDQRDPAAVITYGLADIPEEQAQRPATCNLETGGNIAVFGTSGAGKTTTLRTLAISASWFATPQDLAIYGIDGGAGGLDVLRALPTCGGITPVNNIEMTTRIISRFEHELTSRRDLLARSGASSLAELRRRDKSDNPEAPPRMLLLLDNFGAFATAFEKIEYGRWIELITQIAAEGRALGLHVIISADRRTSVPFALLGVMSERILLRAVDADELSALGVSYKLAQSIQLPDGRALVGDVVVQCAVVGSDAANAAQTAAIEALAAQWADRANEQRAPAVQGLPEAFSLRQLPVGGDALHPCIGVTDLPNGLGAVSLDLAEGNVLLAGRRSSGKTSALMTIAQGILRIGGVEMHALCPRRNALSDMAGLASATVGELAIADALTILAERAETHERATPLVVFFDDADMFAEHPASSAIERLLTGPGRHAIRLVTVLDPLTIQSTYMGWVPTVKRFPTVVALRPELETDAESYGVHLSARPGQRFPAGRGFIIQERAPRAIQVALPVEVPVTADRPIPGPLTTEKFAGIPLPPSPSDAPSIAPQTE